MFGVQSGKEWVGRRLALLVLGSGVAFVSLAGCEPHDSDDLNEETAQASMIVVVPLSLEEIANDPRVESFVRNFLVEVRSATIRQYQIKDKYLKSAPQACRYEVEVSTTNDEIYYLTIDLMPDGSLSIPIGKFTERGSNRSRALDTSRGVAGPLASPTTGLAASPTVESGGAASIVAAERGDASYSAGGSAAGSNPRQATPRPSATTRSEVKSNDQNYAKIEAFLNGWLSSEHKDEIESFVIRGREPTTFGADRYYTFITTMDEHSFNVTVDVYRDGRIRVLKSQKLQ